MCCKIINGKVVCRTEERPPSCLPQVVSGKNFLGRKEEIYCKLLDTVIHHINRNSKENYNTHELMRLISLAAMC